MRFCRECGSSLVGTCPHCGASNPPQSKFCGECGAGLTDSAQGALTKDLSFDQKLAKIRKYLPEGLTEKILSQKGRIEGERRQVTIMFVDMKGFTPLTEMLGPEETFSLMDKFYESLIHKVNDYEGTVMELRGDGIMAFFGAPLALEDAPQRALLSALAIHQDMIRFNESVSSESNIPTIQLRVGINSGSVVVGTIGNDLRVQFTAVGDGINLAARMEQMAEPGTTYVTEETFKLAKGFFHFEALGEKQIKGKKKPLKVYRVIAPSIKQTRFEVSAERGLTSFVGRTKELDIMLDRFKRAKRGNWQALSIVGEAGVGKSRILHEFRNAVSNEDVTFLEGRCLSFSRGVAYHPITDLLKSNFGIEDADSDSVITEKVKRGLAILGLDQTSSLPYLLELLAVKNTGVDRIRMSPEAMKDRILRSLRAIVLKTSETQTVVLALEDLHWMDESSKEAASYFLESIPLGRVMIVFTYRPEFLSPWGPSATHTLVRLNRLSNRESLAIVTRMLDSGDIATDLGELVLEKTDGVPFFIEEFVRALQDMRIIDKTDGTYHLAKNVDRLAIPSTVQDVIMARVDLLPNTVKEVLQLASAIEREFGYDLLKAITDLPEQELLSHLAVLKATKHLNEHGSFPQSSYVFRHALSREVVYNSILTKRKKSLHRKIGQAIEEIYKDTLEAYYSSLADHFMVSEDFQKSAEYSYLTIDAARKQAAITSAISYAQKRIAAIEHLPPTSESQRQLIDARMDHAVTLFMQGYLERAREASEPIVDMVLNTNDKRRQGQLHLILGSYQYAIVEDFSAAFELLEKAISNLEGASDLMSAILAYVFYGLALCWDCQFERGAESIKKALWVNEAAQVPWGVSYMKSNLSYYSYNYQGKVEEGFATSLEALEIAESSGDILSRAVAQVCHGISCFYKGFFAEAEELLLKGIELCDRIHLNSFSPVAHQGLGCTYFETGAYDKSKDHHRKAILIRRKTGIFPSCAKMNEVALARAAFAGGEIELDLASLRELLTTVKSKPYRGATARHLADILFRMGEYYFEEAKSCIRTAIVDHERLGMKWDLAHDYLVLGQSLKSTGRGAEGTGFLDKARSLFNDCGADGWRQRIESV